MMLLNVTELQREKPINLNNLTFKMKEMSQLFMQISKRILFVAILHGLD